MKTNRAVRWFVRVRALLAVAAILAAVAGEAGAASRGLRKLHTAAAQTGLEQAAARTSLGAAAIWGRP